MRIRNVPKKRVQSHRKDSDEFNGMLSMISENETPGKSKKNRQLRIVVLCTGLLIFAWIVTTTIFLQRHRLDEAVLAYVRDHASDELINTMKWVTKLGSTEFLLVAYILLAAWFIYKREVREALAVVIISFGAWSSSKLLKLLFQRKRPLVDGVERLSDYSFPSGHAFLFAVFCGVLLWWLGPSTVSKRSKWIMASFICLLGLIVGTSRIFLMMHYTTDVIGGFALGLIWSAGVAPLVRRGLNVS